MSVSFLYLWINALSPLPTKLKNKTIRIMVGAIVILCLAVLTIYVMKHVGTQYAQQKINDQLAQSGLKDLVHYESINFDPFTLTPSLNNVSVGIKSAPWLQFASITFNHFALHYPNLDIDFWIEQNSASELSGNTGPPIRADNVQTLLGKGSFTSRSHGERVLSHFTLDMKELGILNIASDVNVLDRNIVISEFRADLLASLALGQPEAIFILYGERLEFRSLNIQYIDAGFINHWWPESSTPTSSTNHLRSIVKSNIQALGLTTNSPDAEHIADSIIAFIQQPNTLNLSLLPPLPINLKELTLLFGDKNLYKGSNMRIFTQ